MATWCEDQWYGDPTALRHDVADAFNHELRWLADHGAHVIQLTEQTFIASAGREEWALEMMNRAAHGVDAHLVWHMCYGNAREFDCAYPEVNAACLAKLFASARDVGWQEIHLETARPAMAEMEMLAGWLECPDTALGIGVVEVMSPRVETAEDVAARIRTALQHVQPDRLVVSTDCGLYQLPHDVAFRKLRALVEGTHIVRGELARAR